MGVLNAAWRAAIDDIYERTIGANQDQEWAYELFNSAASKINVAFGEVEEGIRKRGLR